MRLSALSAAAGLPVTGTDVEISGIATDSRAVQPGDLFVAIAGSRTQGIAHVPDALERGAVAVCASAPVSGVPTVLSGNPRRALAALAAAFHGFPARDLPLLGITGSLGKTSTALLLEAVLRASDIRAGVIGSLGVRLDGEARDTGMTTPEAPEIHGALRRFLEAQAAVGVMEVTTHAIVHERVTGLVFGLGVITNLVPDEHLEFHPTPEHYVRTKARFFDMLAEGAPLILNADDDAVRTITSGLRRPMVRVSSVASTAADVRTRGVTLGPDGSRFELVVEHPLLRLDGGTLDPVTVPLHLSLLGRQQVMNAALAATAGLLAGATPDAVRIALARMEHPARRMQVVHPRDPFVLDDTVGNPASIRAVFDTVAAIPHERLRTVYAVRGARGATINRNNAEALAHALNGSAVELVVTASDDVADERNRVTDEEWTVVTETLRSQQVQFREDRTLRGAITGLLEDAGPGDLVLLLGAQGMDRGAEFAREALSGRARVA